MSHLYWNFVYLKKFVRVACTYVRFHSIQQSDPGIDDRFKQSLMTNQSNNIHDGLWSKGQMLKPAFNQRIWIALFGGLNRQIGFSCYRDKA